jgi:hypothetical protein
MELCGTCKRNEKLNILAGNILERRDRFGLTERR